MKVTLLHENEFVDIELNEDNIDYVYSEMNYFGKEKNNS